MEKNRQINFFGPMKNRSFQELSDIAIKIERRYGKKDLRIEFEEQFARFVNGKYAVVTPCGTDALRISLLACDIKPGDEVITSPYTYISGPMEILNTGAVLRFADIDPETMNIDPNSVRKLINKKTACIMPVDFGGMPCDMLSIMNLAKQFHLRVIQDSCQSLGSVDDYGRRHGDLTTFSFANNKQLGCEFGGGAIVTQDKNKYETLIRTRVFGLQINKRWDIKYRSQLRGTYSVFEHPFPAAILLDQLKQVQQNTSYFIRRRSKIASYYEDKLNRIPGIVFLKRQTGKVFSANYYVLAKVERRADFIKTMASRGVAFNIPSVLEHHPLFRKLMSVRNLPNFFRYKDAIISFPCYPELSEEQLDYVVESVKKGW